MFIVRTLVLHTCCYIAGHCSLKMLNERLVQAWNDISGRPKHDLMSWEVLQGFGKSMDEKS